MSNGYKLLTERETIWAQMLMEMLRNNNIPCISSPVFGAGLVVKTSIHDRLKISVPAEQFDEAADLMEAFFSEEPMTSL
ncbi:MAG: hypothetical protein IKK75_07195 [Clostridia bacterium]|nr:hypothetical protein [Clostridia bacterium]